MVENLQSQLDRAMHVTSRRPGYYDSYENEINVLTVGDEESCAEILAKLDNRSIVEGKRAHIGVAGFFNFEIAAKTRPDAILLFDINENQNRFWRGIVTMLRDAQTPGEFRKQLKHARQWYHDTRNAYGEGRYNDLFLSPNDPPDDADYAMPLRSSNAEINAYSNRLHGSPMATPTPICIRWRKRGALLPGPSICSTIRRVRPRSAACWSNRD